MSPNSASGSRLAALGALLVDRLWRLLAGLPFLDREAARYGRDRMARFANRWARNVSG